MRKTSEAAKSGRRHWRRHLVLGGTVSAVIAATLITGFGVLPANAVTDTKLAFTSGPVFAYSTTETQNISVSVEDASSVVDTSAPATSVTLAIETNPSGGTLACASTLTVTTVNGVATFTNCTINAAGNGYTLIATATSLTSAVSSPFNVAGPPSTLVFTSGPVSEPLTTSMQNIAVSVEDSRGNIITDDSARSIAIAIYTNPAGGVLTCSSGLTVVDSSGTATFTGCTISAAGNGYTLIASASPTLPSVVSGSFDIGNGPSKLAFTTGPVGEPLTTSTQTIAVSVEDSLGNVITSDNGRNVGLGIETEPGTGVLSCTSGLTVADTNGVATFTGCSLSAVGSGYVLEATSVGLTNAVSNPFSIGATPAPTQIYGTDAIGTSIAVSEQEFPSPGSAGAVVLARSDFFSDALAGGPLAAAVNGPLLITPGTPLSASLDPRVEAEIQRVLPTGRTVYVLGGDLALSPNIDTTLTGLGYNVIREAGDDEFATAIDIAEQMGNPSTIFEATGLSFYDALSAVPAAIKSHAAILLTDGSTESLETYAYLVANPGDTRYAIGGPLAAYGADPFATPIYGQDLFGTSAAVATQFFPAATTFGAATAADFPDALGGGVFMATGGRLGPLLLVNPTTPLPTEILPYLASLSVGTQGFVFGGPLAVGADVIAALEAAVG